MGRKTLSLLVSLLLLVSCSLRKESADMVVRGGTIHTVNDHQPVVEAVAVKNGKILFAGSAGDAQRYIGKNTEIINLNGMTMTPGFIEGHGHFMGLGYNELNIDLSKTTSLDQIVEKVKEAVGRAAPGQWIIGRGWHQDKWDSISDSMVRGFPTHQKISKISPDNPVYLTHASGHMSLANAKAMEIAGVYALSREKLNAESEGGEVIRDALGNPTGIFNELAQSMISRFIPQNTPERNEQALQLAIQACHRNGITSFHDAGVDRDQIALYKSFRDQGKLTVRIYAMLTGWDRDLVYEWFAKGPEVDSLHWLTIRSVKLNCDGALGSRGAWLLDAYSDRPNHFGMETMAMDTVLKTSIEALKSGFQVCAHAIGDRANREVLDRYEQAFQIVGPDMAADHRFRIEHAQHLSATDIPRFASLGVIPAMQAIHLSSDRPWAIERLGEERIKEGAYVWQKLLKTGVPIVNGTDTPVEPVSPVECFYASVTRQTLSGEPSGGYEPDQKMTRQQALRSYTLDAAYGAFEEDIKGSIEVGKLADFTVFDKDLITVPDDQLLSAQVHMTVVGGKVVYRK